MAQQLIVQSGSLKEVVSADPEVLLGSGVDARAVQALLSFRNLYEALLFEAVTKRDLLLSEPVLRRYLHAKLAMERVEHFHVMYVDGTNHLIHGRTHWKGSVDEVASYLREVIFSAIACGARGIVLAHNHPSGRLEPSEQDVKLTRLYIEAVRHLDLRVLDHWIVTRDGEISFRELGLM